MQFFDVNSGSIKVSGKDVRKITRKSFRQFYGMVLQESWLYNASVKDNVAYGCENIDEQKLNKAIEISNSNFVFELDKGVNSEVAQGGTNFSGGQKQRLSIARAIYKDANIRIFDDTFSALDYKTDMLVRKSIKENLTDKTIIIVAQRIGTIKDADKIIVLDEGRIVGSGTHKELLVSCNLYKEIALSQLSKEEL